MPGAIWIGPTPNKYTGGMIAHQGLVLHIEQNYNQDNVDHWFKDPTAEASAHFTNPKSGSLRQLVDTDDAAWTEKAGNRYWVSVEHEGFSGEALTADQLENDAQLLAWLHQTYAVPLQSTDDPSGSGLGWHGMGGDVWGGHYDCPGEPIKAQRSQIVARAREILAQGGNPVPAPAPAPSTSHPVWPGRLLSYDPSRPMMYGTDIRTWQQRVRDRGWPIVVDGWYGKQSKLICQEYQADSTAHGWPLVGDGVVGKLTWDSVWERPVS